VAFGECPAKTVSRIAPDIDNVHDTFFIHLGGREKRAVAGELNRLRGGGFVEGFRNRRPPRLARGSEEHWIRFMST
jgi:hypothetical protein